MRGLKGGKYQSGGGSRQRGIGVKTGARNRENNFSPTKKESVRGGFTRKDKRRLEKWERPPSKQLYLQYRDVFRNPEYYDQDTGEIHWPKDSGFAGKSKKIKLKVGTVVDRYGTDYGTFVSPLETGYKERAVAPGTQLKPYSVFRLRSDLNVKAGEIAPWFDEPGGGIQYKLSKPIKDLLKDGAIEVISRRG